MHGCFRRQVSSASPAQSISGKAACRVRHLEDDGLGELLEAQLMHVHVRAKGDQPHLAVLWQRKQRLQGSTLSEWRGAGWA